MVFSTPSASTHRREATVCTPVWPRLGTRGGDGQGAFRVAESGSRRIRMGIVQPSIYWLVEC